MRTFQRNRRSGQILVISPLFIVALAGLCALAIDVGHMTVRQAELQNASDAAALAGAQVLLAARADGWDEESARAFAEEEAVAIHEANCAGAGRDVMFGIRLEDGSTVPAANGDVADVIRVTGYRNDEAPAGPVQTFFAGILGLNDWDVTAAAGAVVDGNVRGVCAGLSPFAVPEERLVDPGEEMTFYPAGEEAPEGKGKGSTAVAAGNWGLLDLDGGNNSTPDLRDWILHGYHGCFDLGADGYLWLDGTPGFRATLDNEINQRIGDELIMVIYDEVTDTGANARYRCVGFLLATIVSCDLKGQDAQTTCRVVERRNSSGIIIGGDYESPNLRRVRLSE